jgi:hypothetical protein
LGLGTSFELSKQRVQKTKGKQPGASLRQSGAGAAAQKAHEEMQVTGSERSSGAQEWPKCSSDFELNV